MRIVDAYARLMPPPHVDISKMFIPFSAEDGLQMLRRVEWIARKSHRSENAQTEDSYARFLQTWVHEHGDYSTIEHCVISADILVDRGLSHELVRHRIAAYTQESTRFINYGKKGGEISVILPNELLPVARILREAGREVAGCYDDTWLADQIKEALIAEGEEARRLAAWFNDWMKGAADAEHHYLFQLSIKVPPELARDELPHKLATNLVATHNLRGWRHLMIMRTSAETHRKLRPLMGAILLELKSKVPILYADLEYGAKQSENLKKGR